MKNCTKNNKISNLSIKLLPFVILLLIVGYAISLIYTKYKIPAIILVLVVYFVGLHIFIKKYNFKIIVNDEVVFNTTEDKNIDYVEVAKEIVKGLGGTENIVTIDNCITRLRLELVDSSKIDKIALKKAGAMEIVVIDKSSVQIILGPQVQYIAEEMKKIK